MLIAIVRAVERGVGGRVDTEVAMPQIFDGTPSKISGFITVCKLYLRIKIKEAMIEEHMQ